jgi:hypothetical protein
METTAGALALVGARPREDATIARKLRESGMVVLGKASMSEWAYFKSTPASSGWSARNGQSRNPYALDRSPCGSSSGSAIAVAANLVAVSIGTETDGSIICPAGINGIVGIKPTVGLTSRAGVIPISASQDTVGPFGRTVADAVTVLGALVGVDPRDPGTKASAGKSHTDYRPFLDPEGARGARIGVPRGDYFGYSAKADAVANQAIDTLRGLGAVIVDPVQIPNFDRAKLTEAELIVFRYEFKAGVNAYLAALAPGAPVHTLADVIAFNKRNPAANLPFFGEEWLDRAQATPSRLVCSGTLPVSAGFLQHRWTAAAARGSVARRTSIRLVTSAIQQCAGRGQTGPRCTTTSHRGGLFFVLPPRVGNGAAAVAVATRSYRSKRYTRLSRRNGETAAPPAEKINQCELAHTVLELESNPTQQERAAGRDRPAGARRAPSARAD